MYTLDTNKTIERLTARMIERFHETAIMRIVVPAMKPAVYKQSHLTYWRHDIYWFNDTEAYNVD